MNLLKLNIKILKFKLFNDSNSTDNLLISLYQRQVPTPDRHFLPNLTPLLPENQNYKKAKQKLTYSSVRFFSPIFFFLQSIFVSTLAFNN